MLKLKKDTQFIDPEEKIISESIKMTMDNLFKTANEVNKKLAGHTANYITVSEEVAKELDKFKWDVNTKKRYGFY